MGFSLSGWRLRLRNLDRLRPVDFNAYFIKGALCHFFFCERFKRSLVYAIQEPDAALLTEAK